MTPRVSVVIPTFNAGPSFEALLEKLSSQKGDFTQEVLVVDSGSKDGTVELARRYGATVYQIPQSEFNHGATRNLGISLAEGKYVALTVQDAVPLDERWLAAMVENLENDERVVGVYGRQVPHPGSSALTRVLTNNLLASAKERHEQYAGEPENYPELSPEQRWRLAAFDNVSSCIRRSVWEEIPFEKTNFGEDLRWSKKAVEAGYKLVYEPRSTVFHSHERGAMYDLRRHYVNARILAELFDFAPVRNLPRLVFTAAISSLHVYGLLRIDGAYKGKLRPALVGAGYAIPAQVGSYLGTKAPMISRISPRLYVKLDRFLGKGI